MIKSVLIPIILIALILYCAVGLAVILYVMIGAIFQSTDLLDTQEDNQENYN